MDECRANNAGEKEFERVHLVSAHSFAGRRTATWALLWTGLFVAVLGQDAHRKWIPFGAVHFLEASKDDRMSLFLSVIFSLTLSILLLSLYACWYNTPEGVGIKLLYRLISSLTFPNHPNYLPLSNSTNRKPKVCFWFFTTHKQQTKSLLLVLLPPRK